MVFGCCWSSIDPTYEPVDLEKTNVTSNDSLVETSNHKQDKSDEDPTNGDPPLMYLSTHGSNLSTTSPIQYISKSPKSDVSPVAPRVRRYRDNVMAVMVPNGMYGGQMMRVMYPDGSGRQVDAQIPIGMTPGSIFHIKVDLSPSLSSADWHSPKRSCEEVEQMVPSHGKNDPSLSPPRPILSSDNARFLQREGDVKSTGSQQRSGAMGMDNRKLLKVTVPPGAEAGSTVHVQIPGEHRYIVAQIPPDCTEFYVQYEPRAEPTIPMPPPVLSQASSADSRRANSPLKCFTTQAASKAAAPFPEQRQESSSVNSRLLVVQVPPGVQPGATLQVQVPGEPGRVVSAQVPPGNVREFQVSYTPKI
ncbi:hypothetical protein IV203_000753 [Nitzschia inconspicua]|uniref:Uncharacterized protein n=1 Tax=Nitzschia inconspicua TaxID=303405 RepID=A0A9K3PQI7_9STRA|nr:hypothetical protein IV203_000753 [Nitzschia inconspicua]